ncbi:MAG: ethanolamine ammonia-lyase reactivating factor EutA [Synergistaceae bacterium]|nr:ethanolamine ammonia-lyase reactivating factor EutA [Synergistota bacterium]NLM70386.1 ethanolamine ammonia-lyase reactivating factor EutA [Synergistaceae bacterium]
MAETVLSVGIDIGTSTTQLVFSELEIENTASVASVPRIAVVDKRVIFRSGIHFTPLLSASVIDADGVRRIIESEYRAAGMRREKISAGAVIITGETARKENAETLARGMEGLAGDFVVVTAGSDLEAILAGKGSGAAAYSKSERTSVANFDMGGGTTNVAIFRNGEVADTSCLDIGGRLVRLDPASRRIEYVAPCLAPVVSSLGLSISEGRAAPVGELERLAARMAAFLDELMGLAPRSRLFDGLLTSHDFRGDDRSVKHVSFSGGVADGMAAVPPGGPFVYGDIGILLGQAARWTETCRTLKVIPAEETIRATVVGAGSHSMDISGSTISFSDESVLPLRNLPILKLSERDEREGVGRAIAEGLRWFRDSSGVQGAVAVSFRGLENPSFDSVQALAAEIRIGLEEYLARNDVAVLVLENDMAKALGYALRGTLGEGKKIVSIDGIKVENGDYIDIGRPLARGRVLPVVIKTLVFGG